MELICIGKEKLKIILTHEDLRAFEIDESELDYTNTETKRMLWDLLNRAKHSVGFDTDGHRVLVQLYPSHHGGCELFITKLGALCPTCEFDDEEDDTVSLSLKHSSRQPSKESRLGAFGFDTLDHLLRACRRLHMLGHLGQSYAYHSDEGRYYLFLDGLDASGYFPVDEYSFLSEYGTSEQTEPLQTLLLEHGSLICQTDAVSTLGIL